MNAPQTSTLSANGSRLRPTRVSGPYFRAHQPSSQSVAVAMRNTIRPASHHSCTMHANNTTASGMRANESKFGMCKSGSGADGADADMRTNPGATRVPTRSHCRDQPKNGTDRDAIIGVAVDVRSVRRARSGCDVVVEGVGFARFDLDRQIRRARVT